MTGGGVCVYGEGADTFTMRWDVVEQGSNTWKIVAGTGRYTGMTGHGTSRTRIETNMLKMPHRVSDWEGEVDLPRRN